MLRLRSSESLAGVTYVWQTEIRSSPQKIFLLRTGDQNQQILGSVRAHNDGLLDIGGPGWAAN